MFVSTPYIDCLRFGLHSIKAISHHWKNRKVWTSPKKWHFPTESSFSQLPAKWESHLSFPWFHDISRRKNLAFHHDISEDPYKQLPQGLPAMAKIQSVTGVVSPPISVDLWAPILVTGNRALFVPQVFLNSLYWLIQPSTKGILMGV